ncbi:hypothetical protein WJX77_007448 [Trebouxia sp. C0004]
MVDITVKTGIQMYHLLHGPLRHGRLESIIWRLTTVVSTADLDLLSRYVKLHQGYVHLEKLHIYMSLRAEKAMYKWERSLRKALCPPMGTIKYFLVQGNHPTRDYKFLSEESAEAAAADCS